ncbi:hypothetical protein FGG79_14210 [Bacillus sp. BHET2]|uniref:DUF3108 domain-containing protein n=1 Tax=Bacillus sp. BHET2 TaxID=2583818 RepID=UPI0014863EF1|nr:hypothetical protein [Bacillus sp. BHET2]TMU85043.1 hypothetical protein FGG79_14210 [Bacillus sp. BHET2]
MERYFQPMDSCISIEDLCEARDEKEVFLIEEGVERKVGETTEEIQFIEVDGKSAIKRVQTLTSDLLGNRKGVTVVERTSFKPISFTDYINNQIRMKAVYRDGEVHVVANDDLKIIKLKSDGCVDTFSIELVLRVIPFTSGFFMKLKGFNSTIESEIPIRIEVLELESIHKGEGIITDAWKVKTYFGDTLQYYWIDSEHKELLKQSSYIGEGRVLEFRR